MSMNCKKMSGGRGNVGKFIERIPSICAAGKPTKQMDFKIEDVFKTYGLQDEVDALIGDSVAPPGDITLYGRKAGPDFRNAITDTQVGGLINPPPKTKFHCLIEDLKSTTYASYWKKVVGQVPDPKPMFPEGMDPYNTVYGKPTQDNGRLYDTKMPRTPVPPDPPEKRPGYQLNRKYCESFRNDLTYGSRYNIMIGGSVMKPLLADDRIYTGNNLKTHIAASEADFKEMHDSRLGKAQSLNRSLLNLPEDHTFGRPSRDDGFQGVARCTINPDKMFVQKCLAHLNAVKCNLSKRCDQTFYHRLYLEMKYLDTNHSGWLPKHLVYNKCKEKLLRFDGDLIEPLLEIWHVYNGSEIEYKTFIHILNHKEVTPDLPKINDFELNCSVYKTEYSEACELGQEANTLPRAGMPSDKYLCIGDKYNPPVKNPRGIANPSPINVRTTVNPNIFTLFNVSINDMYAIREPELIREACEAAIGKITDEEFQSIWDEAKKYHSEGKVCFKTFYQVLQNSKLLQDRWHT